MRNKILTLPSLENGGLTIVEKGRPADGPVWQMRLRKDDWMVTPSPGL
jgi:hypothetical protein